MTRSATPSKYLKYFGWLAPVLLIMGFTARLVSDSWDTLPLALVLSGVLVLVLWLVSESNAIPGFLGQRSTQASTNILVATLAMLVILGLVNFLAVRSVKRIDLTENQLFTLAPQTQQLLNELEQPVKALFFRTGENLPSVAEQELLENYRRQTEQFNYEIIDPQANPALAQQFGVQTTFGEVYLESGNRQQLVQVLNPGQPLTERQLTNGIVKLLSDRQSTVYFIQGHGEHPLDPGPGGLADAVALLEGENYRVESLNLAQSASVPDDADVVILAGAQQSLFEAEVEALEGYLSTRSGLLVLLNPQAESGLDPLFEDWGIEPIDRLIIDPAGQAVGADITTTLIQSYGEHPITEGFGANFSFFPTTQPINLDVQEQIESAPLLISSDITQAFIIPEEGELDLADENAMQGPLVFGVALNQPIPSSNETPSATETDVEGNEAAEADAAGENIQEENSNEPASENGAEDLSATDSETPTPDEARLVVIGNSNFILNSLVSQQLNGDVFLNTVGWLSQSDDQSIAIRPKEATNRRIVLSTQKLITIALTAIAILPLIGFSGAVFLWLRRR